ncbi:MAG: histidinol-phosphate transaminase [Candidatus Schekmanbacteria bacterium]|nr:MAG: histidinol-phosphate transaminase [Candidatus Schekmanbacteria bacterium]
MKKFVPDYILSITPYNPGKPIEEVEREFGIKDPVKLASNENPLGPSPKALNALKGYLKKASFYPDSHSYYLKQQLAAKFKVSENNIAVGNGSNELLEFLCRAFIKPGVSAVMADQAFMVYKMLVQATGGEKIIVPLRNHTHDLKAMLNAVRDDTRIIFIANPNNPTGTIVKEDEFEEFLFSVPEDVIIVLDEAYAEYVSDEEYPNSIEHFSRRKNLVILRTFSKIYGLAGLRIGYAIASEEIIDILNRIRQPFNVNSAAQTAALAALSDEEHINRSIEVNEAGKDFLYKELEKLNLDFVPTEANFILIDCKADCDEIFLKLLKLAVIVRPMKGYDFPTSIRVTIGTAKDNKRFISSLERILNSSG